MLDYVRVINFRIIIIIIWTGNARTQTCNIPRQWEMMGCWAWPWRSNSDSLKVQHASQCAPWTQSESSHPVNTWSSATATCIIPHKPSTSIDSMGYMIVQNGVGVVAANLMQSAQKDGTLCEISQTDGYWPVQGHSRLPILVPLKGPHVTLYLWTILTNVLSLMSYLPPFPSYCSL